MTPTPGIYFDVPFADYLAWDAVSNSALHSAARSMAHYRCRKPVEETPAMRLGSLVHTGRLEPLRIAERYVVMPLFELDVLTSSGEIPANPKATKAYREKVGQFAEANKDKTIVTQAQYDAMRAMVGELASHPRAAALLEDGQYEVSIVWHDVDSGLLCKGRIDCWQRQQSVVVDIKTTADAGRFERQILDRAYHRQLAMYADGLAELTDHEHGGALVAVESGEPYSVRAALMSQDAMDAGHVEYKRLLRQIAQAVEAKCWPGYDSPEEWTIPVWAQDQDEVELVIAGEKVKL